MVKRMSIKEFRESGLLQEINRLFLHPLGLALEIIIEEDGTEKLGGIWDYREHPEGILYGQEVIEGDEFLRKAYNVANMIKDAKEERIKSTGFWIQPIPED